MEVLSILPIIVEIGEVKKDKRIEIKRLENQLSINNFKVLVSRVMNIGEESKREVKKDRKIVLKKKNWKKKRRN